MSIDKLETSYVVGDPIIRGIAEKLNEVIESLNSLLILPEHVNKADQGE